MVVPEWNQIFWYVVLGIAFGLEMLGVFDTKFTTLTAIICSVIPAWARALIAGWLVWHFLIQHPN